MVVRRSKYPVRLLLAPDLRDAIAEETTSETPIRMPHPWNESATLVRLAKAAAGDDPHPAIVKEGKLIEVARHAAALPKSEWKSLKISLYERHVAPFGFRGATLIDLLDCVPRRGVNFSTKDPEGS